MIQIRMSNKRFERIMNLLTGIKQDNQQTVQSEVQDGSKEDLPGVRIQLTLERIEEELQQCIIDQVEPVIALRALRVIPSVNTMKKEQALVHSEG